MNNNHDISALLYKPSSGISALQNITFSARGRRILNYRTRDPSLGMRAHYIAANRAAPLWNYDQQCHDSLETELIDLPRFCAISNCVHQIQGTNIVYEVKRSESSCTSRYMNCPLYVCLFEPLAGWCLYEVLVWLWTCCPSRASMSSLFCCFASSVIFSRLPSRVVQSNFYFKTISHCNRGPYQCQMQQPTPPPTHSAGTRGNPCSDDDIILPDISSRADLPARPKREQIVRSLATCSPGCVNI